MIGLGLSIPEVAARGKGVADRIVIDGIAYRRMINDAGERRSNDASQPVYVPEVY